MIEADLGDVAGRHALDLEFADGQQGRIGGPRHHGQHIDTAATEFALGAEPRNADALVAKRDALQGLLKESGGSNLSETMWLKSEITAAEGALAEPTAVN